MSVEITNNNIQYVKIGDIAAKKKYSCVGGPFGSSLSRKHYVDDEAVPVIRGTNLNSDQFIDDGFVFVSEEKGDALHRNMAYCGDIVFTQRGTLGQVALIPDTVKFKRYVVSQSQMKLTVNNEIADPYYVYSYFRSQEAKKIISNRAIIGGVPHINLGILKAIEIPLPSLIKQKKITSIIKSLDDKIQLNRQLNQTLEQIAQAIFKSWFVDFGPTKAKIAAREALLAGLSDASKENNVVTTEQIADAERQAAIQSVSGISGVVPIEQLEALADLFPNQLIDSELGEIPEGWGVKSLDKVAHYQNGLALQKFRPDKGEEFLPVLKISHLKAGFTDGKEVAKASIKPECIIDNGDVVFSWSASLLVDIWCGGKAALNQHLFKVTSKEYPKWFYTIWTKHHLEKFIQIASDKAVTMGHIKRSHLSEAKCVIPTSDFIELPVIATLIDKQINTRLESNTLEQLRDSLLPKLLSGELPLEGHK